MAYLKVNIWCNMCRFRSVVSRNTFSLLNQYQKIPINKCIITVSLNYIPVCIPISFNVIQNFKSYFQIKIDSRVHFARGSCEFDHTILVVFFVSGWMVLTFPLIDIDERFFIRRHRFFVRCVFVCDVMWFEWRAKLGLNLKGSLFICWKLDK